MEPMMLGLGCGRCGTKSLAALAGVPHEPLPLLPWLTKPLNPHRPYLTDPHPPLHPPQPIRDYKFLPQSCVAFYLLPYVRLWPEDTKIIVLKRERASCVRSYCAHLRRAHPEANPFDRLKTNLLPDPRSGNDWSMCYPNYLDHSNYFLEQLVGRFYDEYYATCEELNLPIYKTHQLNTPSQLGLSGPPVRLNRGVYPD